MTNKEVFEIWKKESEDFRASLKEIQMEASGIGKSNGMMAEEMIFNALDNSMKIKNIEFDSIVRNIRKHDKLTGFKDQFDIILENENSIALIEVKYRVRDIHVDQLLEQKINNFNKLFSSDKIIIPVIAGLSFDEQALDLIRENDLIALSLTGGELKYI